MKKTLKAALLTMVRLPNLCRTLAMRVLVLLILLLPVLSFGSPESEKQWFEKTQVLAAQGSAVAQLDLGNMYYMGRPAPQDVKEAIKWWRLAAEQGKVYERGFCFWRLAHLCNAKFNLARVYMIGENDIPKDDKERVKWNRLAADEGHAMAQKNVGYQYFIGEHVPKDNVHAYMWLNIAGANGLDVKELKERLTGEMSKADIAKAKKKTRQYIKFNPDVY